MLQELDGSKVRKAGYRDGNSSPEEGRVIRLRRWENKGMGKRTEETKSSILSSQSQLMLCSSSSSGRLRREVVYVG